MKKNLLNPTLALAGVVGAALLTGCASNPGYSEVTGPRNALAYTTVTDPKELTKWTQDEFMRSLRSVDTYYFQVPDTGYRPGSVEVATTIPPSAVYVAPGGSIPPSTVNAAPGETIVTPLLPKESGLGQGLYQTETRSYRVIEYRPGHSE